MAKGKVSVYFCQSCGYESGKWMGQCPGCKQWNSFVEEMVAKKNSSTIRVQRSDNLPVKLSAVDTSREDRYTSGFGELDRVLGG